MSFLDLTVSLFLMDMIPTPDFLAGGSLVRGEILSPATTTVNRAHSSVFLIPLLLLAWLPSGNAIPNMTSLRFPVPLPPGPSKFPLQSPRGAKLATRVWPVNRPKALCLFVHGGGWHSGYFQELAIFMNRDGIFCASYDQVSCGYSEQEPDTPAPGVTHVRNFDCFVEDVCAAIEWMQKEADNIEAPVFLFGESFGSLQVMGAALEKDSYGCKVDGVIASGGLLSVGAQFLPPAPVVKILVFLARYYPRLVMPATDFESTFDDAFGDKDWAKTARQDPKISTQLKPTIGAVAATLSTGELIRAKANEFPVKFYAVHGERDVRTPCEAMQEFVDQLGPEKASMDIIDTAGHQLLQDQPEITNEVMTKTKAWILKTIKDMK